MSVLLNTSTTIAFQTALKLIENTKRVDEDKLTDLFLENVVIHYVLNPLEGERIAKTIVDCTKSDVESEDCWLGQFKAKKIFSMEIAKATENHASILFSYESETRLLVSGLNCIKVNDEGKIEEFGCYETEYDPITNND